MNEINGMLLQCLNFDSSTIKHAHPCLSVFYKKLCMPNIKPFE